jgi:fucose permease
MVGATLGARLSSGRVLWLSLAGASAGGLLLVAMQGQAVPSVLAIALMGFGFGPIFPTTVATATARFPNAPGRATSLIVAMGSLGGMLLPWIQGQLLDGQGPAAIALFVAACILAMLALHAAIRAGAASRRQAAQA